VVDPWPAVSRRSVTRRPRILPEVLGRAFAQTGVGLLIGRPAALFATSALASLLIGVASLILVASAVLAAVLPARHAASINPTDALRAE
jgi:ABC-type antimicrobial peptide transport system permease subunit